MLNEAFSTPGVQHEWSNVNEDTINAYINEAMSATGNNISAAHDQLTNERQQPQGYYDQNLAIAADYLRARMNTANYGIDVALGMNAKYMNEKANGQVQPAGPGPVSPWSQTERDYMDKGAYDQWNIMPTAKKLVLYSLPGTLFGGIRAIWDKTVGFD